VRKICGFLVAAALVASPGRLSAYSVLAHEAAIDVAWDSGLRPLLRQRFPRSSPGEIDQARAFAYGGSVIQDLGYYPFGTKFFSNLLHYTRSGDFVETLLRDARDLNEYAFALGALAHYANDNAGHPEAVNLSVPLVFPKLRAKFGDAITYEQAPKEHVIVEYSFDVSRVAGTVYPISAYRNLIGFQVALPLLERAFRETYGLEMRDVFANTDRAISTYRYSVSQLIPALTETAWRDKREEIAAVAPKATRETFVFAYGRPDYERDYGSNYRKPALFARFLAFVYRIVPKVGPLRPLAFEAPTPQAEKLFAASFRDANDRFAAYLASLRAGRLDLRDTNFDTGGPSRHGRYGLADQTYEELLNRLSDRRFERVPPALGADIVAFYGESPRPSAASSKEGKHWKKIQVELAALKYIQPPTRATNTGN
jgi:hypothetical protein